MAKPIIVAFNSAVTVAGTAASPAPPQFDALAASFGALSVALTWGAICLTFLLVLAGFGWVLYVRQAAERIAREEATAVVTKWLADNGRAEFQRAVSEISSQAGQISTAGEAGRVRLPSRPWFRFWIKS